MVCYTFSLVQFAAEAYPVVPCFQTFVQANHWNKQVSLGMYIWVKWYLKCTFKFTERAAIIIDVVKE